MSGYTQLMLVGWMGLLGFISQPLFNPFYFWMA